MTHINEKTYEQLTEEDAREDGFVTLELLKDELRLLNGELLPETPLFIHHTENIIEAR